jgi:hypothetical protein
MVRANVTPALVALSRSPDVAQQTFAVSAMANLCEMVEGATQQRMLAQGLLRALSERAADADAHVRREVGRCWALLATKSESQLALVAAGAVDSLAKLLKDCDHAARLLPPCFNPTQSFHAAAAP